MEVLDPMPLQIRSKQGTSNSPRNNEKGGGLQVPWRAGGAINSTNNNAAWQPNNKDLDFDIGPIPPSNRSTNSSRMQRLDNEGSIRSSFKKTNQQI